MSSLVKNNNNDKIKTERKQWLSMRTLQSVDVRDVIDGGSSVLSSGDIGCVYETAVAGDDW